MWEVKNPKQRVIQKAFIFGFEMHGGIGQQLQIYLPN